MKKLLLLLLLSPLCSLAQIAETDKTTGQYVVYQVFTTDKEPVYILSKAKQWIAYFYNSPKDVMQLEMSDQITGKGLKTLSTSVFGYYTVQMKYSFSIKVKEGKYMIELYNIRYSSPQPGYYDYSAESRISDANLWNGSSKDIELNQELKSKTMWAFKEIAGSLSNYILKEDEPQSQGARQGW